MLPFTFFLLASLTCCRGLGPGPGEDSAPEDVVRHNILGTSYLGQQKWADAEREFRAGLAARPEDPVLLVNVAVALLQQGKADEAEGLLRRAAAADPASSWAHFGLGLIEKNKGNFSAALEHLRKVAAADPGDVTTQYQIGSVCARLGRGSEAEAAFRAALALDPNHISSLYGLGRWLLQKGDSEGGGALIARSQQVRARSGIDEAVGNQYGEQGLYAMGEEYPGGGLAAPAPIPVRFSRTPTSSETGPDREGGEDGASASATPRRDGSPETAGAGSTGSSKRASRVPVVIADLAGQGRVTAALVREDRIEGLGEAVARILAPGGEVWLAGGAGDLDGDGTPEVVLLGRVEAHPRDRAAPDRPAPPSIGSGRDAGGSRGASSSRTALSLSVYTRTGADAGAWHPLSASSPGEIVPLDTEPESADLALVDYDHDGDLDVVYCWSGPIPAQVAGASRCRILTNDGKGGFGWNGDRGLGLRTPSHGPISVLFSDFDNDRDIDLVVVESDGIRAFANQRDGTFLDVSERVGLGTKVVGAETVSIADLDKDGWMDLIVASRSGLATYLNRRGRFDRPVPVETWRPSSRAQRCGVVVLDFDNDGFLDIAANDDEGRLHLDRNLGRGRWGDASSALAPAGSLDPVSPVAAFDADGDGDLDLLEVTAAGAAVLLVNDGGSANRWIDVAPRGVRDNRSGIGAKVEILAGALRQKFEVTAAVPVHAGLGARNAVDAVRVLWPGGVLQDEIGLAPGRVANLVQLDRKGTSCPILYAWSGGGWRFVTDFLGGCAIGYQEEPGRLSVPDTDEYVKIDGGLDEQDGRIRLRMNNQLEEVIFFDQAELLAVDHPIGTEVFSNERLMPSPPWPPFRIFASTEIRPVRRALEIGRQSVRDVTGRLASVDRSYPDGFARLPFKGYAEPHTLELDLGAFPSGTRVILLLDGWIDYADSTANIAAAQAGCRLEAPRLLVPDGSSWREVRGLMGFPAGLPKTMSVDLTGIWRGEDHRVRIETSMRIYWDRARVMVGGERVPLRIERLGPVSARLRFGGFPAQTSVDGAPPFAYNPSIIAADGGFKAHAGVYTPFGDVTGLLRRVDDRFVVTRGGDEIEIEFAAPPPPAPGTTRTWILHADGFGKDMDPNSAAADEVAPMPFHGMPSYPYPASAAPPRSVLESFGTAGTEPAARLVTSGEASGACPLPLRPPPRSAGSAP